MVSHKQMGNLVKNQPEVWGVRPLQFCSVKETYLLIDCYRSKEVWAKLFDIGITIPSHRKILDSNFGQQLTVLKG